MNEHLNNHSNFLNNEIKQKIDVNYYRRFQNFYFKAGTKFDSFEAFPFH